MKHIITIILLIFLVQESKAAAGDTTWVTIYNLRKLTYYGNYDTSAVLPTGKTYRKIRLHYILGRYACPAGTTYCGSWDYTTQVRVKPPSADTVEIARVITPYATDWLASNKKNDYIMDITDYSSVLNGNLDFRFKYDGYSWGFTLTLKIEFIEGTPPMNNIAIKNIYDGYYPYGNAANPIENYLIPKPRIYNTPVAKAFIRNTISGHGSDDNGCGEFCSKYYDMKINGTQISQKQLWRADCGINDIFPQTGTWIYDRANWCPGNIVKPIVHDVTPYTTSASTFTADIDFEPYTSSSPSGGFNVVSQLITYSAPNYSLDASIEDIMAPTDDANYFRSNNICSNPKVKIKNTGTTPLTSVVLQYNLRGGAMSTYTFTGNLNFLQDTIVDLGPSISMFNGNESNVFEVAIHKVNGIVGDQNTFNNVYTSKFVDVRSYPNKFVVYFKANKSVSTLNGIYSETTWKITNDAGVVVKSRVNNNYATSTATVGLYVDTVNLPNGCYTFTMDDDGCDGISWWAYSSYPVNPGTGIIRFNSSITPTVIKNFSGDFGCQIKERFTVGYYLPVNEISKSNLDFQLFPNPASNEFNILLDVKERATLHYTITDLTGKEVLVGAIENVGSDLYTINTQSLQSGLYFVNCKVNSSQIVTKKIVITK